MIDEWHKVPAENGRGWWMDRSTDTTIPTVFSNAICDWFIFYFYFFFCILLNWFLQSFRPRLYLLPALTANVFAFKCSIRQRATLIHAAHDTWWRIQTHGGSRSASVPQLKLGLWYVPRFNRRRAGSREVSDFQAHSQTMTAWIAAIHHCFCICLLFM